MPAISVPSNENKLLKGCISNVTKLFCLGASVLSVIRKESHTCQASHSIAFSVNLVAAWNQIPFRWSPCILSQEVWWVFWGIVVNCPVPDEPYCALLIDASVKWYILMCEDIKELSICTWLSIAGKRSPVRKVQFIQVYSRQCTKNMDCKSTHCRNVTPMAITSCNQCACINVWIIFIYFYFPCTSVSMTVKIY